MSNLAGVHDKGRMCLMVLITHIRPRQIMRVNYVVTCPVDRQFPTSTNATDHYFGSNSPIADCSGAHRSGTPFLHALSVLIPTYHATLSAYSLALSIRCRKRCSGCSTLCVIKGGTRTCTVPEQTLIRNKEK